MIENFGLHLKHERELRGVSLEEIAESTKIHIRFLEALENNEFDVLPGEVFIKGYIRSYARVIGVNDEELLNTYDESAGKGRREEIQKAQIETDKVRSRRKTQAGYVFAGIALIGVIVLGYLVVGSMDEKNKNAPSKIAQVADSTLASGESENFSNHEPLQAKSNSEELPAEELQAESLLDESSAKPVSAEIQSDPIVEESNSLNTPQTLSDNSEPNLKKIGVVDSGPNPPFEASASQPEDKKEQTTPQKSEENEKSSDISEKGVIIQYLAESVESADSDPILTESDSKPLHLKIQVQGNSWFNVSVDDGGEEDFILPGGASKNIYGSERFRVTIGNRQGTHLYLNGQSIDLPPGSNDVIRDFDITANLIE